MRDTSDMMEDAMSKDTMMDCGNDADSLDGLVNLASDISESSSSLKDAAERLLTLLGVEDSDDDFLSSSEDEGVEIDMDDNKDDNEERPENVRLLHQLANSLAEELKYTQKHDFLSKHMPGRCTGTQEYQIQHNELPQEIFDTDETIQSRFVKFMSSNHNHNQNISSNSNFKCHTNYPNNYITSQTTMSPTSYDDCGSRKRFKIDEKRLRIIADDNVTPSESTASSSSSWDSGWNACAHEAVRYLIEEEGLPPHHPTVLALKNHLFMQRDKAFTKYFV